MSENYEGDAKALAQAVWRKGGVTEEARIIAARILRLCPGSGLMLKDVQNTRKKPWCKDCGIHMESVEGYVNAPDHAAHGYAEVEKP